MLVSDRGKVVACGDLSGVWAKLENSVSAGVNLAEVVHEDDVSTWHDALLSPQHSVELRLRSLVDAAPWVAVRAMLQPCERDGRLLGYFVTLKNLAEIKDAQQQLLYQATHDELTRLPNRRICWR